MTKKKRLYTLQELADFYNVEQRTIYNWLKPIRKELIKMNPQNPERLRCLNPKQVKFIKKFLG